MDERRIDPRAERSRRRIAQAVYELHSEIGPARTTVSAIAERAGVERLTVYRNFPDELDLYRACLEHWRALHPWPDPAPWREIADPRARLRRALAEIYVFYEEVEPLFFHGAADMPKLPKLQEADAPLFEHWEQIRRVLLAGWGARGRRRDRLAAALGLAVDFQTWFALIRREGLRAEEAIQTAACLVDCAARPAS
ncbi:MAG TPA: TetR/AcrR family transcriptional regulator [Gaiellaceae bacterium]|nr:TetR/AcrR family transcriptional regulator [Gaiellaceae bacterium]